MYYPSLPSTGEEEDDDDDIIILDNSSSNNSTPTNSPKKQATPQTSILLLQVNKKEPLEKTPAATTTNTTTTTTTTTATSASNPPHKKDRTQASHKINPNMLPKDKSGFIQINDKIYPYVCLFNFGYRCTSSSQGTPKYPICFKYVSVKHLAESMLIPLDLYANKGDLTKRFKTYRLADQEDIVTLNGLIAKLGKIKPDNAFVSFTDKLELVNLVELYINFSKKALYLQELDFDNIPRKIQEKYDKLLSFTGGILQYKIPETGKHQILPFIDYENKKLVICASIKNALNAYITKLDQSKHDLSLDVLELSPDKLSMREATDFYKLILMYICIDQAKFSLNAQIKFLDIKKWLRLLPDKLKVLCSYTPLFPVDWIEAFYRNGNPLPGQLSFDRLLALEGLFVFGMDGNEVSNGNLLFLSICLINSKN